MSVENHPNIHAVGFAVDIIESLMTRLRGPASGNSSTALSLVHGEIVQFVSRISETLDSAFPLSD